MAFDAQAYTDGWCAFESWINEYRENNDTFLEYEENETFKSKLTNCDTNKQRFALIWQDDTLKREFKSMFHDDTLEINDNIKNFSYVKNATLSKQYREAGNKSFRETNYEQALAAYTQAIKYAPYPESDAPIDDCLAIALANRSAAAYSLGKFKLCVIDIDTAIAYHFPKDKLFKLHIRKVKALHNISEWSTEAESIKAVCKAALANPATDEKVKAEMLSMFDYIEQPLAENLDNEDDLDVSNDLKLTITNTNKKIPSVIDCIDMNYTEEKGRFLETIKDVSFGRLLMIEEPFACNLAPSYRDKFCYNCFADLLGCGMGCKTCTQVLFCSEECRDKRQPLHSYECNKILDLQTIIGVPYLVAHIMFRNKFNYEYVEKTDKKKGVEKIKIDDIVDMNPSYSTDGIFKSDYFSLLTLMDHAKDYDFDDLFSYAITAGYLLTAFIKLYPEISNSINDQESEIILGSLILRHLLQLQTNLISVLSQKLEPAVLGQGTGMPIEFPIGVAIYPTISMMNHSCSPNIFSVYHKNKFVARAAKMLPAGTEINYCYGPSIKRMSRKDRQEVLKAQYFFDCKCESCSQHLEDLTRALVCSYCKGPVIYNRDLTHECRECHKKDFMNLNSILQQIGKLKREFVDRDMDESEHDVKELASSLEELKRIEEKLSKLLYWRNPLFLEMKQSFTKCAVELKETELALKYCEDELEFMKKLYGNESYELLMTRIRHLNYKWQLEYHRIEKIECEDEKRIFGRDCLEKLEEEIVSSRSELRKLLTLTNVPNAEDVYQVELKYLNDIQKSVNKYLGSLLESDIASESLNNSNNEEMDEKNNV